MTTMAHSWNGPDVILPLNAPPQSESWQTAPAAASPAKFVLLPGLDGTGTTFEAFVAQRPSQHDVQVISYPADRPAGYDELLELVWEQLPVGEPFYVLGESFSGPLAVRVAARMPAGLRGVVLCASFVRSPTPWIFRYPSLFTPRVVGQLIRWEAKIMRSLLGKRRDSLRRSVGKLPSAVCPEVIAARVRATMTVDVTAELRELTVPMLYLAGRWDVVIPRRSRTLIQKLRPEVECRMINGPHALLQTRPQEAWEILHDWCARQLHAEDEPVRPASASA